MFSKPTLKSVRKGLNSFRTDGARRLQQSKLQVLLTLLLAVAVTAGLGVMLYSSRDLLLNHDWEFRPLPFLAAFLIFGLALALTLLGWGHLMSRLGVRQLWRKHVRIYCVTNLAQRLPGVFWHVLGRMAMYQREGVAKRTVAVVSGLELLLMILAGLVVSLLMLPLMAPTRFNRPELLLAGLLLGLVSLHPRVIGFLLDRLKVTGAHVRGVRYRDTTFLVAVYAIVWLLGGLILFGIIMALYPLPAHTLPSVIGAWSLSGILASVATFTPSGFGLRELSLTVLLTPLMPAGMAAVIAIATRVFLTICQLFWALTTARLLADRVLDVRKAE